MPVRVKGERVVGEDPWARWSWPGHCSLHCSGIITNNACFQKHPGLDSKLCYPPYW